MSAVTLPVTGLLDGIPLAAQLLDIDARLLHETPALRQLLSVDAEAPRVRTAMAKAAREAAVVRDPSDSARVERASQQAHCLRTAVDEYRLFVSLVDRPFTPDRSVLVAVQPRLASGISGTSAHLRYRLTPREVQVARLLAAGLSSREMADVLECSVHTVRRHTEHTLSKLGVTRRARVAGRLQDV